MAMQKNTQSKIADHEILSKLDAIILLLQDLFIIQGLDSNFDREGLREVLGVKRDRVSRISKLYPKK